VFFYCASKGQLKLSLLVFVINKVDFVKEPAIISEQRVRPYMYFEPDDATLIEWHVQSIL